MEKTRLDKLLVMSGLAPSREKAQALIGAGQVFVDGVLTDKAGTPCPLSSAVEIRGQTCPYVSRGGTKLEAGLDFFNISPAGMICLDAGASTGGFTDCLLQHGAVRVYAVDVGYGQLDWKLRQDPRVLTMERTNIRFIIVDDIPEPIDFAVVDTSFISLKLVIPPLLPLFRATPSILALIKPQFEVGKGKVGKGGVVRDPQLHQAVIDDIIASASLLGLKSRGVIASPLLGPKGNKEFLIHLVG